MSHVETQLSFYLHCGFFESLISDSIDRGRGKWFAVFIHALKLLWDCFPHNLKSKVVVTLIFVEAESDLMGDLFES